MARVNEPDETMHDDDDAPPSTRPQHLKFKQSLKTSSNTELVKRLKALHEELSELDQDVVVTSSLDSVARELLNFNLSLHPEQGVKAYLASCLADILRLYAPEAPYTEREIKDIFEFFIKQMKHLATPEDPHFSQYFYLIESLSSVKSIVLICDLEGSDELMRDVFKQAFDALNSKSPKNVEICLADILLQLIEESSTISQDVVEILIAQFLPKAVKERKASHRLAIDVCTGSSDKLQRYVCQYFAEQITSHFKEPGPRTGSDDDDQDFSDSDDEEDEDKRKSKRGGAGGSKKKKRGDDKIVLPPALVTCHELIRSINRSVPSLLTNVIPLLEDELRTEQVGFRQLAAEKLGQMFGEKSGQGDLAARYPWTWKQWLQRVKDKSPVVRTAVVSSLKQILIEHPELAQDIEPALLKSLEDTDDGVRLAACNVFENMDYETASNHISVRVLKMLAERVVDKKPNLRAVANKTIGRLYDLAFVEIQNREEHATKQFGWIPTSILSALLRTSDIAASLRYSALSTFLDYIVPIPSNKDADDAVWVDRLLCVMKGLDQVHVQILFTLTRLAEKRPTMFEAFIHACEKNNGGVIEQDEKRIKSNLDQIISHIAARSPDHTKTTMDLQKFAKANEKQLYKLLKTLMDPQSDLKMLLKTQREIIRRVTAISTSLVDTFKFFMRSATFWLVNRSSIPTLLKRLSTKSNKVKGNNDSEVEATASAAASLLQFVSKQLPIMYKSHVAELTVAIGGNEDERTATVALQGLSKLIRADSTIKVDKKLAERVRHFVKDGSVLQAKYAATIMALDSTRPSAISDIVEFLSDELETADDSILVKRLAALSRIARYNTEKFEPKSEAITGSGVTILLRGPSDQENENKDLPWTNDAELADLTKARALVVKLVVNRCIAYANTESAQQAADPVFKLVWPLLQSHDEEESRYTSATSAYLRLTAASAILKLAAHQTATDSIAERFELFARTAQDECFEVRIGFINRLLSLLRTNKIVLPRYNMVLFLVAHDPEEEIKLAVTRYIRSKASRSSELDRQRLLEHPLVRLIHLLAHHPDFEGQEHDSEEIATMSKYIEMYLETLASERNISFLWHLAMRVKSVRDKTSSEYDMNLYILSELAQLLIKRKATAHGWAISSLPNNTTMLQMPSDIFRGLDKTKSKQIYDTVYLTDDMLDKVTYKVKVSKPKSTIPSKRKSPQSKKETHSKRNSTLSKTKKKKKVNRSGYDSDENESVSDSDQDDAEQSQSEEDDNDSDVVVVKTKKRDQDDDDGQGASDSDDIVNRRGPRKKSSNGAESPKGAQPNSTRKGLRSSRGGGGSGGAADAASLNRRDDEDDDVAGGKENDADAMLEKTSGPKAVKVAKGLRQTTLKMTRRAEAMEQD
ncbi:Sister chromatid cohesion protein pds5 [Microbotryomycetes sp. JL221]|nr:Sister chromatid cohesion protein pds5 [Microbotryomycetes sp. JL221]